MQVYPSHQISTIPSRSIAGFMLTANPRIDPGSRFIRPRAAALAEYMIDKAFTHVDANDTTDVILTEANPKGS